MKGLLRVFAASREKDWIGGSPIRAHAKARRSIGGRSEGADPMGSGRYLLISRSWPIGRGAVERGQPVTCYILISALAIPIRCNGMEKRRRTDPKGSGCFLLILVTLAESGVLWPTVPHRKGILRSLLWAASGRSHRDNVPQDN